MDSNRTYRDREQFKGAAVRLRAEDTASQVQGLGEVDQVLNLVTVDKVDALGVGEPFEVDDEDVGKLPQVKLFVRPSVLFACPSRR